MKIQLTIAVVVLWTAGALAAWCSPVVDVSESNGAIHLRNDYIERTIEFGDETVRTTSFLNRISGRSYSVSGDEFNIKLIFELWKQDAGNPLILTTHDFHVQDKFVQGVEGGGKRVIFHLIQIHSHKPYTGVKVTVTYELMPLDFYTRKWIQIETDGDETDFIDSVAVEANLWLPANFSGGGFGQPLLGDDLFLGLEYPSSLNTLQGSALSLGYIVGENIPKEGFTCESAVFGVSANGEAHNAFMKYVERIRVKPPHLFLTYSAFGSFPPVFGDEGVRADVKDLNLVISELGRNLVNEQGVKLDSFTSDGGWDDLEHLWAFDPKRFSSGFQDLREQLDKIHTGLGIWLGPNGGYGKTKARRIEIGARIGMESTSNHQFLCFSGRNYSRFVKDTLLRLRKEQNANMFKLDGLEFTCNDPSHGHPVGIYSREASVRVLVDILKSLHDTDPEFYLALSTGPWRSPWWVRYGESVDWGAGDFGYLDSVPSLTSRQSALSYFDAVFYQIYRVEKSQFPMSSLDTEGLVKNRDKVPTLGGESLDDWKDATVNLLGGAVMKPDLYITPDLMKKDDWSALGTTLRYMEKNVHPLLDNSTFILGSPARREPYGFLHYSPAKTIVVLRNPFVRPTIIKLKLDSQAGFERNNGIYRAEVVFPYHKVLKGIFHYGDSLNLELDGYEQSVVELHPVEDGELHIVGARYSMVSSNPQNGTVNFRLYGPTGDVETASLVHGAGLKELRIDGAKIEPKSEGNQTLVPVRFGKNLKGAEEPNFSVASPKIQGGEGTPRNLTFSTTITVPADFRENQFALLLEPAQPTDGITARVRVNEATRPVATERERGQEGVWYWFKVALKPGKNLVNFNISLPADLRTEVALSGWLRAKRELASTDLVSVFQPGQVPTLPADNSLPASSDLERKTYKIFEQTIH